MPGQTISYTVSVTGINGFDMPVDMSVLGLPTGVESGWDSNPVMPGNASTVALVISNSVPLGDYWLVVVGTASTQVTARTVSLVLDYPYKVYCPFVLKSIQ